MTVSTSAAAVTLLGNGSTTSWSINFIMYSAADIQISYYNGNTLTILNSTQYTLSLNAPASNQLYGIGGSLVYPITGSPIANGTYLIVQRIVPYVQLTSILNQGNFSPQVIEQMGDNLEFQLQQLASRTTQFRGTWQTGIQYNYGDIVQDGVNGANTLNYYICTSANTSGVWATDLAAGDWVLSVQAAVPVSNLQLTGAVTGTQVGSTLATTLANNIVGSANIQNNAVGTSQIAAAAVTITQIASNAVTTPKIADSNVTEAKLVLADNTTANVTTSAHGFAPKLPGTTTTFLRGDGTYAIPPVGSSELVLLGTATASTSASLNFTSLISSSYDYYFFILKDLRPSTSSILWMRASIDNGATYISATSNYSNQLSAHVLGGTTITVTGTASGSATALIMTANTVGPWQGKVNLLNPLSASNVGGEFWDIYDDSNANIIEGYGSFGNAAVNAVQFLPSIGTLTSGAIEMYGVKNT